MSDLAPEKKKKRKSLLDRVKALTFLVKTSTEQSKMEHLLSCGDREDTGG